MKCKELQVGDKVALINGIIATIIEVGENYAYAVLNGYETMDPWEFNDQDNHPEGIPITPEILEKNGWKHHALFMDMKADENINFGWTDMFGVSLYQNGYYMCDCKYAHTLQHALRLAGLSEIADNFKV